MKLNKKIIPFGICLAVCFSSLSKPVSMKVSKIYCIHDKMILRNCWSTKKDYVQMIETNKFLYCMSVDRNVIMWQINLTRVAFINKWPKRYTYYGKQPISVKAYAISYAVEAQLPQERSNFNWIIALFIFSFFLDMAIFRNRDWPVERFTRQQ